MICEIHCLYLIPNALVPCRIDAWVYECRLMKKKNLGIWKVLNMKCKTTKAKSFFRKYFCWNCILWITPRVSSIQYPNQCFFFVAAAVAAYIFKLFNHPPSVHSPFCHSNFYLDLWHISLALDDLKLIYTYNMYIYAHKRSYASNKFSILNPRNSCQSFILHGYTRISGLRFASFSFPRFVVFFFSSFFFHLGAI